MPELRRSTRAATAEKTKAVNEKTKSVKAAKTAAKTAKASTNNLSRRLNSIGIGRRVHYANNEMGSPKGKKSKSAKARSVTAKARSVAARANSPLVKPATFVYPRTFSMGVRGNTPGLSKTEARSLSIRRTARNKRVASARGMTARSRS